MELGHGGHVVDRVAGATEALEEATDPTERGGTESVAVVTVSEGDEAVPLGFAGLLAVLGSHFQGALDGGGAVVREKDAL